MLSPAAPSSNPCPPARLLAEYDNCHGGEEGQSPAPAAAADSRPWVCPHFDTAELDAVAHTLLLALSSAMAVRRRADLFPRAPREAVRALRLDLCRFLDALGPQDAVRRVGTVAATVAAETPETGSGVAPTPAQSEGGAATADSQAERVAQAEEQGGRGTADATGHEGPCCAVPNGEGLSGQEVRASTSATLLEHSEAVANGVPEPGAQTARKGGKAEASLTNVPAEKSQLTSPEASPRSMDLLTSAQEQGQRGAPPALHLAPYISNLVKPFVERQHTFLTRVSESIGVGPEAAAEEAQAQVTASGLWGMDLRREVARLLILWWDKGGAAHCGMAFASEETLRQHQAVCPLRTVRCANLPCPVTLSHRLVAQHDKECPHKLLPCPQQCQQSIARGKVRAHCSSSCPMRLVPCPWSALPGCSCPPFRQHETQAHLTEATSQHQMVLLQAAIANQEALAKISQRLSILEKAQELHEKAAQLEFRPLQAAVLRGEQRMGRLEREHETEARERRQLCSHLRKDCDSLKKQVQALTSAHNGTRG